MLFPKPTIHFFTTGAAEGLTRLNSFDNALLKAHVGNTNLIKMSSICPPKCRLVDPIQLPQGALVPVAYASITRDVPGETIAAGVAIAYPVDEEHCGLIMEYSGIGTKDEIEHRVRSMAYNGMTERRKEVREVESVAIEHIVTSIGTTFAAVVLWTY